jgi:hypothetical protein
MDPNGEGAAENPTFEEFPLKLVPQLLLRLS